MRDEPYRTLERIALRADLELHAGQLSDGGEALLWRLATDGAPRREALARLVPALSRCQHPGLPALLLHDVQDEASAHLATEMPRGTSLAQLLDEGLLFGWREAVAILGAVAGAVGEAHGQGLAHLALRPDTILLRPSAPPMVAELGVVSLLLARADRPTRISDPDWTQLFPVAPLVAPELLEPDGAGPAADVYALGVLLFRLVAGQWPHEGDSSVLVYNQARAGLGDEQLRARLGPAPGALLAVIRRATRREPAARYPDAKALADALAGLSAQPTPTPSYEAHLRDERYAPRFSAYERRAAPNSSEEEEEERRRRILLAEMQLEGMRSRRKAARRSGALRWVLLVALLAAFVFALPILLERGTPVRPYPGGVDPQTGLTHKAPPRPTKLRQAPEAPTARPRLGLD